MKSDVRTTFCPNFDFTVKALMISNSLYHRNFQTKTDMKAKICFHAKLCTQNKILASKMRNLKQQKTSVFAPLILKRWIIYSRDVRSISKLKARHFKGTFYLQKIGKFPKNKKGTSFYCRILGACAPSAPSSYVYDLFPGNLSPF